jgi:hypothetical protein
MVIALAAIAVPAVTAGGGCKEGVLGEAQFQTGDISFPAGQDANYDQLNVGNDKAIAVMGAWGFWGWDPVAKNNLNIEKVQKSLQECKSCCEAEEHGHGDISAAWFGASPDKCSECANACSLINVEQVNVGSRTAIASGPHTLAENNINIKTVQV